MSDVSGDAFHPRTVLGIDAAWTCAQPSGVALAVEAPNGGRLAAVEASYGTFIERANGVGVSDATELLDAARLSGGWSILSPSVRRWRDTESWHAARAIYASRKNMALKAQPRIRLGFPFE